jgi:flagellar hook-basal body complex protein FliE
MNSPYVPKIQWGIQKAALQMPLGGHISQTAFANPTQSSFQQVMMNTLGQVNAIAQKPDAMVREAMTTGNVDVHDVMIANAKAELTVNLASQMTTKVIQAYDRLLQIQV